MYILEVKGTKGYIQYQLETGQMTVLLKEDSSIGPHAYEAKDGRSYYQFDHTLGGKAVHGAHQQFIDELDNESFDYAGAIQGIRNLQVIRAIRESAASGNRVYLTDTRGREQTNS
jgi:predicted dehydrogenase